MNQPDVEIKPSEDRILEWSSLESLFMQTEQAFSNLVTGFSSGEVSAEEITAAHVRMEEIRDRCDAAFERAFGSARVAPE